MAEGRGSAVVATVVLSLLVAAFNLEVANAQATRYTVGDTHGWTFGVSGWEKGKNFKAGDILNFKYLKGAHNVVIVDKAGYDNCTANPDSRSYTSGNDEITLSRGLNNFICSIPVHCSAGMKISVNAS